MNTAAYLLTSSLFAFGGVWLSTAERAGPQPTRVPIAREAKPTPAPSAGVMDQLGEKARFRVELFPDAVLVDGKSETIEYHAEIISDYDARGTFAWTATLVDDRGIVVREIASGGGEVASGEAAATEGLAPTRLPDGFFSLHVRAALVTDDSEDAFEAVQFLRVKGGQMREMSATDWYQASQATLATEVKP